MLRLYPSSFRLNVIFMINSEPNKGFILKRIHYLVSLFLIVCFIHTSVSAEEETHVKCLSQACFSLSKRSSQGEELSIVGGSRYRFWGFSVYTVALYLKKEGKPKEWWNEALAFELYYHRSLKASDFTKTARKLMAENPAYGEQVSSDVFQEFASYIASVSEGDRYTLLYSPDGTLELLFNGTSRGKVIDKSFAQAYIGMWLGEYAVKESNRDQILAGKFEG